MEFYIGTANFAKNYGYKRSIISKSEIIKIIKYLKKRKNLKLDTSFSYDKFFKYSNNLNLQKIKYIRKIKSNKLKTNSIVELKYGIKKWNKNIPKKIKIKSDIEQIKQTIKMCCFFKPCSITKIF